MRLWRHTGPRQVRFTYDDALLIRCDGHLSEAEIARVTPRWHRIARYTRYAGAVVMVNAPANIVVIEGVAGAMRRVQEQTA